MNVQFIQDKEINVAYFPNSKRFFIVNDNGQGLIKAVIENKDKECVRKEFNLSENEYIEYKSKIREYSKPISVCQQHLNTNSSNLNILNRLVINLSNCCNLRCKYCYANGGNYHSDSSIMTKQLIDDVFAKLYSYYDEIRTVQLFGGEPLMNMDMIEYTCQYIKNRDIENKQNTNIGLVTNGTLIDDRFIELVKKYNIYVTISYDGDPLVNDLLRIDTNGKGTSYEILKNAKQLKASTGQPNTFEVTFNKFHIENNVTILDVIKHINLELPDTYIHLVPAGGGADCEYSLENLHEFVNSVDDIFDSLTEQGDIKYSYSLVQRFISSLIDKTPGSNVICDAGMGTLSVSINGDIYPCFMFTDLEEVRLGNIYDEDLFTSDRFMDNINRIAEFSIKEKNQNCQKCYIKNMCNGCLGFNHLNSGDIFIMDDRTCDMYRQMAEKVIIRLAKLMNKGENKENVEAGSN